MRKLAHFRPTFRWALLACLFLCGYLFGACNKASNDTVDPRKAISLAALPTGSGRGFPTGNLAGIDNTNTSLHKGAPAPDFRLQLADGRYLSLHDLHGHPLLLNFWASWCGPCRLEMPEIIRQANTNPHLVVLAINVQEQLEQIRPFVQEFQMNMPVVQDRDGTLRNLYQVRGLPTSVFIDPKGNIFTVWAGVLTRDVLNKLLDENH